MACSGRGTVLDLYSSVAEIGVAQTIQEHEQVRRESAVGRRAVQRRAMVRWILAACGAGGFANTRDPEREDRERVRERKGVRGLERGPNVVISKI